MHHGASPGIFNNARKLRRSMTVPEQMLWEKLCRRQLNGFHFRNQHPMAHYILDFYCHQARLAIEVDGGYHQEEEQRVWDENRTEVLNELGITVLRFSNEEVSFNMESVLSVIKLILAERVRPS
ncbi:MAG: endonuclease domain-containing protein [Lewinellaceae bacterium]|nr:endonuclease domain-containing protein [Lewinellaceae bacterium]